MRPVLVIGAGISGLSTAYYLTKLGIPVTLVERRQHLGGVITTDVVDGCVIEGGPDSFLAAKPWAMELIQDLGLADQVIGSNDHLRVTFVLRRGRLVPLPDGLMMMVPTKILPLATTSLLSWGTKFRMGIELFRRKRHPSSEDRSVAEFIEEHYGREAVDYLAEPLLAGVYGGTPQQLSVNSVLPRFVALETKYGSLTRGVLAAMRQASAAGGGAPLFRTLKGGLSQITGAIEAAIEGTAGLVRGSAKQLQRTGDFFRVRIDNDWLEADEVVLACPAYEAGALCGDVAPDLTELLARIPYSSSMTVALGYDRSGFAHPLDGFGFLVPEQERDRLIACTWVGTKFPYRVPKTRVVLRCFLGGAGDPDVLGESDEAVERIVRAELRRIMGVTEAPVFTRISRWPRSMAQYTVGHAQRVHRIEDGLRRVAGLHLVGNAYHGIGIPDCVHMGKRTAEAIAVKSR